MKKQLLKSVAIAFVGSLLAAGSALAVPNLYDVTRGNIAGTAGYLDTGVESAYVLNSVPGAETVMAYMFFEFAGYQGINKFGIYDVFNPGEMLQVFDGDDASGDSAQLTFAAGTVTNEGTSATANIGGKIGFYLASGENTYYSHTALNADGFDHMLMYDTSDHAVPALLGSDIVLAWEDLYQGGDQDWDDMVIGITNVSPVPEPATMLLFGAGLAGLAGVSRRRKAQS